MKIDWYNLNAKRAKIFFEIIENIFKTRKDVKLIKEKSLKIIFVIP